MRARGRPRELSRARKLGAARVPAMAKMESVSFMARIIRPVPALVRARAANNFRPLIGHVFWDIGWGMER
jgi:hypothetical protein